MPNSPPQYPLMDQKPGFGAKLSDPLGKLCDPWLHESISPLLLTCLTGAPLKESRKRYRQGVDAAAPPLSTEAAMPTTDSGDDMIITDSEALPARYTPPAKRRLTISHITDAAPSRPATSPVASMNVATPVEHDVHPCTPVMQSMATTPVSDLDEQNAQQLVLPLPLASPVQSARDKLSAHQALERQLAKVPANQGELIDLMLGLSNFVLAENKNNLIFSLLQRVGRLLLLAFCDIIQGSLNHDVLSSIHLEIALNILSLLDAKSLLAVSQVCRSWNRLVSNTKLWCYLLKRDDFVANDEDLRRELANPAKLVMEWATPSPYLTSINYAQLLYKKRYIILKRWMNPAYEPKRISIAGHGSNIVTCLQHDEDKVITGIEGKLINVHSTKTGELSRLLKGHDGGVWALKYFSNTLVSGSTDRDVRVWNIRTGRCTHVFRGHTSTVRCLDILHPVQIGVNDNGLPIIFPEQPLLVTGSRDHNLHVWKLPLDNEDELGEKIVETKTFDSKDPENPYLVTILSGHTQSVRSVTGYGNIIISGSYDTTVRVWDLLDGGRCKHVLEGHSDKIYSTALNYDTRRCFSGSMDLSINVWDFEKGKLLYSLEGHNLLVGLLELSDRYLVSAAADSTLRVWDPKTGENLSKLKGHNSAITCFQHDGLRIVSGSERMLKLWDIRTGKFVRDLLSDITGSIWQVSFDSDRCVAAVHTSKNGNEETYIEILDFSAPLNDVEQMA